MKVCAHPGCPNLTNTGNRCPTHTPPPWTGGNPDATQQRRQRTTGTQWQQTRHTIAQRDHHTCWICHTTDPHGHVDHITPVSEGGTDHHTNLAWICKPCHRTKSAAEGGRASQRNRQPPTG